MATFNTVEELLQILDRDPVLLQSLRARLLTKDLLELPQRFTTYAEATDRRLDIITQRLDDLVQRFSEYTAMSDARFEHIETNLNALTQRFSDYAEITDKRLDSIDKSIAALIENTKVMDRRLQVVERRLDDMDSNFKRLGNDFSRFRSNYARAEAIRSDFDIAMMIAAHLGIGFDETSIRILSEDDKKAMARAYGTDRLSGIPFGDRRSFYRADMILEVPVTEGDIFYAAVQASYACNGRDSRRAIRQAELLTMFTGKQAYPVVAGVRVDWRIQPLIDRGEVFWLEIEEERLEPDEAE